MYVYYGFMFSYILFLIQRDGKEMKKRKGFYPFSMSKREKPSFVIWVKELLRRSLLDK